MRVEDEGSCPHKAAVDVQGIAVLGVLDSGADITIMNRELFKRVAVSVKKEGFQEA